MSDRDSIVGNMNADMQHERKTPGFAVGQAHPKGSVGGLDEGLR